MPYFLSHTRLDDLLTALQGAGRRLIGPQARDGVIVYDEITAAAQLPWGVSDQQRPGSYRLQAGAAPGRVFAWTHGAQCLKPQVFAPVEVLWTSITDAQGLRYLEARPTATPLAIVGVRACDLAALSRQDRIFLSGGRHDPHYAARRAGLFLVAVNCTHAAETCFCASTGTGPDVRVGHDVVLTELEGGFVAEAGSEAGASLLDSLGLAAASDAQLARAAIGVQAARAAQQRKLPPGDLSRPLQDERAVSGWAQVAERCLACGNCTLVCPTCFCHAREDLAGHDGQSETRLRRWDSCFGDLHGHLAGYQIRPETTHRYRQWLTHKLGTWWQQFGESGCVGCGRCITWCPAGIDLVAEARALLEAAP